MLARIMEAPTSATSRGESVLTAPSVPTGMKAGVSTDPCGVKNTPERAAPSVAKTSKRNDDDEPITGSACLGSE